MDTTANLPVRSGASRISRGLRFLKAKAAAALRPAKPVLKNAAASPLTIAGVGCFVAGVFILNFVAGLMILAPALVLIEHLIADGD